MAQIPILNGIYTGGGPDFRTSYPVNLVPVPKPNGISLGYLRPADGIVSDGEGPGGTRGGINWKGICYRVMGPNLVRVNESGTVDILGSVGGTTGLVTMDYSFDKLSIASNGNLFYWDGATLAQVTDPDLGAVVDQRWIDGYFMTTDGTSLVVTELTDPFAVNPLKYGSSESDPDSVKAILKLRNEMYAINRYTIEVFENVGGTLFPFQRIEGAQIQKGAIGTHACCVYSDAIAFVGSGRNEAPSVYLGQNSSAVKIGTRELDTILLGFSEAELSGIKVESRNDRSNQYLYVHLPDRTMIYDLAASQVAGEHVWYVHTTATVDFSRYRAHCLVWCYDQWLVGDPLSGAVGHLDPSIGSHWGQKVRWEFGTQIVYNMGAGVIFNQIELQTLPGRVTLGENPAIGTSWSNDGETWSQEKYINIGGQGDRLKRMVWFHQGHSRKWRIQRFRGDSSAHLSFAALEAQLEPLAF